MATYRHLTQLISSAESGDRDVIPANRRSTSRPRLPIERNWTSSDERLSLICARSSRSLPLHVFIAGQRVCRRTSLAVGLIGPEHPWKTSRVGLRSYVSATQQIPVKRTTTDADGGLDLGKVRPGYIACSLPLQER